MDLTAERLRTQLLDIGDGLQAQLYELSRAPTPERCERAALNLEGARTTLLRLRERLIVEGEGGQ